MIRLAEPNDAFVRSLLEREGGKDYSYAPIGMTRGGLPPGYLLNFARIQLGASEAAFQAGKAALSWWAMYALPWVRLWPQPPKIEEGSTFAAAVRSYGLWSVNLARVVYRVEEPWHWGFAIGTLPHHVEAGEERFSVKCYRDGGVWFEIRAYTSLRHWLARAASPLAIQLLRRFGREACVAMARKTSTWPRDTGAQR
jgi:uncharacterized protein (UPF0548 family)